MFTLKPNPDNISKEIITAEMFKKATGRDPIQDDLERCNCDCAGESGNWACGWNIALNMPVFMVGTGTTDPFPKKENKNGNS
jgi:hypothetical protein